METYGFICRDGQNLSQILYQEYGYVDSSLLFEVLDLNPGLSSFSFILSIGTRILLPVKVLPDVPTIEVERL